MKKLICILILAIGITSCGKDNSSGSDNTSNGAESEKRYLSLSSSSVRTAQSLPVYINDNLGIFRMELLNNKTFRLYREGQRRPIEMLYGSWSVSGTSIVLDRMGSGSYLESTMNGVIRDCILMNNQSLGAAVLDELRMAGASSNAMLRFCKRR